jgi:hypothetical protein
MRIRTENRTAIRIACRRYIFLSYKDSDLHPICTVNRTLIRAGNHILVDSPLRRCRRIFSKPSPTAPIAGLEIGFGVGEVNFVFGGVVVVVARRIVHTRRQNGKTIISIPLYVRVHDNHSKSKAHLIEP